MLEFMTPVSTNLPRTGVLLLMQTFLGLLVGLQSCFSDCLEPLLCKCLQYVSKAALGAGC